MKRAMLVLVALLAGNVFTADGASAQGVGQAPSKPSEKPPTPTAKPEVPKPAPPGPQPRPEFKLPEGAIAFHFGGGRPYPNFKTVRESSQYNDAEGFGWVSTGGLRNSGNSRQWPFGLVGNYLWNDPSIDKEFVFKAKVPNRDYLAWMLAGPIIRGDIKVPHYLLKINDTIVCDEKCTPEQFNSTRYLFHFLWTQYSEKPHNLWDSYMSKMFPMFTSTVKVTNGELVLTERNHILGAMILVSADKKAEFEGMDAMLRKACMEDYESRCWLPPQTKPEKAAADGECVLWVPEWDQTLMPDSGPDAAQRQKGAKLERAGAPGQRVVLRLAVTPFAGLGRSSLELADLKGPGTIPASTLLGHFKNYYVSGINYRSNPGLPRGLWSWSEVREVILLPTLTLEMEKGITQEYWLVVPIPTDARPGMYQAEFVFKPGKGDAVKVPVELEVYPFRLEADLPASFGMYGVGVDPPLVDDATRKRLLKERLEWMRGIGFTAVELSEPRVPAIKDGKAELALDPTLPQLAKDVGMGKRPEQAMMFGNYFTIGRHIGKRMVGPSVEAMNGIDRNPGSELKLEGFDKLFIDAVRRHQAWLDQFGLPIVFNVVDEPREKGVNPWNRNFDDTVAYIKLLRQAGKMTLAEDPMRDKDTGTRKDYTEFIDYVEVMSTHAWAESTELIRKTLEKKKILWIYNTGMDRFSWGFYNWRIRTQGRWEWHFCFPEEETWEYYVGLEWYSPLNRLAGFACLAPFTECKGAMLYTSRFLTAMEGINDYAYLYTLEQAIQKARGKGAGGKTVEEAEAFLADLGKKIPEFPKVRGLATGSSGAAVGQGAEDSAVRMTETWRKQIAGYLKELAK